MLDECIDERFRHLLASHDCQTARFAGLAGLKNGTLLYAAAAAGFDAVVTAGQSIPDQQNFRTLRIALVILCARTNRLRDLEPLIPATLLALNSIAPGQVIRVR